MTTPVSFRWTGETMEPLKWFHNICASIFVIGQTYTLEEIKDRSSASHRHYFACIHDAWLNLSEAAAVQFPTSEHLRKIALIASGYADIRTLPCSSRAEALRLAAFIRPIDTYAIVHVKEAVVTVSTAQSQSVRAMGAKEFQASKTKTLDYIAVQIGTTPAQLERNAREAA